MEWHIWYFLCPASETPFLRCINNFSLAVATSCRTVLGWRLLPQLHGHLLCNHGAASRLTCMGPCNPWDAHENLSPLGVGGGGWILPFVIPWLDDSNTPSTWLLGDVPWGDGELLPTADTWPIVHLQIGFLSFVALITLPTPAPWAHCLKSTKTSPAMHVSGSAPWR